MSKASEKKNIATKRSEFMDTFLPDVFEETKDYIYLGTKKYSRVYVIDQYPKKLYSGILNDLFAIENINISTYVENIEDAEVIRKLTDKITNYQNEIRREEIKGKEVDEKISQTATDLYNMRENVQTNKERMSYIQILITIWGENAAELDKKGDLLEDICALKGLKPRTCVYEQGNAFISSLPYKNVKYKGKMRNGTTGVIASLVPVGSTEMAHLTGLYLGENLYTNSPILLDNFIGAPLVTNPMMGVFGKQEFGKEVVLKMIASRAAASGEWVFIIDSQNEYENVIKSLGGQYINVNPGEHSGINPFELDVEKDEKGQVVNLESKVLELIDVVSILSQKELGKDLTEEETAIIEEVIKRLYSQKGITEVPDTLFEEYHEEKNGKFYTGKIKKDAPTFSDLKNELEKIESLRNLASAMKKITGQVASFDGQSLVNLENKIVAVNLEKITDAFDKFFAITNILTWVCGRFSDWEYGDVQKRVMIDESWIFSKFDGATKLLNKVSKIGRKYNISIILASEHINEFLEEEKGNEILSMCATKFIMKQDKNVASQVTEYFVLSETAKEKISGFREGQGLLMTDQDLALMQMMPFDFEWDYITN